MHSNGNTTPRQHKTWPWPCSILLMAAVWLQAVQATDRAFDYPDKSSNAVSISFDDGSASQVQLAVPLLDRLGVKATFYLLPYHIRQQLPLWQQAVKNGHEIGNHTSSHTCTGNFRWLRNRDAGLEQVDLAFMQRDLQASPGRFTADIRRESAPFCLSLWPNLCRPWPRSAKLCAADCRAVCHRPYLEQ